MDFSVYFDPVTLINHLTPINPNRERMGDIMRVYTADNGFPDLEDIDVAILGVEEDRNASNNIGCCDAPDQVRGKLYHLFTGDFNARIADLGNIKRGHSPNDTYFAVTSVLSELLGAKILPVIIGGSQEITYFNYKAYENIGQIINIVSIDPEFDLGETEEEKFNSKSYLSRIILHQPNFLFNYTNIGYQTYFVDQDAIRLMKNLFFDAYRLGEVRANLQEVEPLVRNADLLTFDMSAIRFSDAPGNGNVGPNGFYGEEACQIIRYAGLSDKLTSIGFYEMNPSLDQRGQSSHLVAQMIWYFIDGFYKRKREFPYKDKDNFIKYIVKIEEHKEDIVFYKSNKSDRWWMEVNCPLDVRMKYERHYLIPCSYKDYQTACENDIPDRWWQAYQKLM
jgi:arginase family enzyme